MMVIVYPQDVAELTSLFQLGWQGAVDRQFVGVRAGFVVCAGRGADALAGVSKVLRVGAGGDLLGQSAGRGSAASRRKAVASSFLQGQVALIRRRRRRPPRVIRAATCRSR